MYRTKDGALKLRDEIVNNPKGDVANAAITGANVALTMFMGPIPGWLAAKLGEA